MTYYLRQGAEVIKDSYGDVLLFSSYSDARHWAINHLDFSGPAPEIVQLTKPAR